MLKKALSLFAASLLLGMNGCFWNPDRSFRDLERYGLLYYSNHWWAISNLGV